MVDPRFAPATFAPVGFILSKIYRYYYDQGCNSYLGLGLGLGLSMMLGPGLE